MASRARKFCLEMLDRRELLTHSFSLRLGDGFPLAKGKAKTVSVDGTIDGTTGFLPGSSLVDRIA